MAQSDEHHRTVDRDVTFFTMGDAGTTFATQIVVNQANEHDADGDCVTHMPHQSNDARNCYWKNDLANQIHEHDCNHDVINRACGRKG